jgi:hypothetical protein
MTTELQQLSTLMKRLERVENENRRLKHLGLAIVIAGAVLVLMGQARPSRDITAQRFTLTDMSGNKKAELGLSGELPHLWFYGPSPKNLEVSIIGGSEGGQLTFSGADGSTRALLQATQDGAVLNLYGAEDKSRVHLGVGTFDLELPADSAANPWLTIFSDVPGPSLVVRDKEGFSAAIGSTGLRTPETGETRRTSAASTVLFAKDGKVLWSAP